MGRRCRGWDGQEVPGLGWGGGAGVGMGRRCLGWARIVGARVGMGRRCRDWDGEEVPGLG